MINKAQDTMVRQIRRLRAGAATAGKPPEAVEGHLSMAPERVLKVLQACDDDEALAAFVLVCFGERILKLEEEYKKKFEQADEAIKLVRERSS